MADLFLLSQVQMRRIERKRCEHTRACPSHSGDYLPRANLLGIQNWRMASTAAGMLRHAS